ncbi:MAG: c(7)-type cytochrome triheme domain-containing protein [Thermodesulfobacteriota bacterium]
MKIFSMSKRITFLFSILVVLCFIVVGTLTDAESATKKKKRVKKIDPSDPTSVIYLGTSGKLAGTGDGKKAAGIGYQKGRAWHPQALNASGLPRDRFGLIDWAKIVRQGLIKPRHSLNPKEDEMPPLPLNIEIAAKGDFVNNVLYPHEIHTWWLKCDVCHPKIFVPAKGQNNMSMVGIVKGKWCGRCHNKIAFPLSDCKRCHTVPKKKARK